MDEAALLMVEGLTLRRANRDILCNVTLEVRSGKMHGLLGLNGSGKSSLAYALMGCAGYVPDAGIVRFDGRDLKGLAITDRARLGLTLAWQEPARIEGMTVERYLAAGMREHREDRMQAALEAVGLHPARFIRRKLDSRLSGGERKRIELAAVYAMQPRLAMLDEPDSGIDVLSLADITTLLRRMTAEGTAVLVITHRDELTEACDVASLMCEGTITVTGKPEEVRDHYRQRCRPCDILLARQGSDRISGLMAVQNAGGGLDAARMQRASAGWRASEREGGA